MTKQMNKPSSLHRGGKPNFVGHSLREHRHQHQSSRFYQLFQYTTKKITDKQKKKNSNNNTRTGHTGKTRWRQRRSGDTSWPVHNIVRISLCQSMGWPSIARLSKINAETYSESGLIQRVRKQKLYSSDFKTLSILYGFLAELLVEWLALTILLNHRPYS